jgi:sialate O-acetylesterase
MKVAPLALLAASWFAPIAAASPPRLLADPFQDHAVLQRDRPIPVWGRAAPGESLTVSLAGQVQESQAGADGHWRATLPAMPAGGPHRLEVRTRDGEVQIVGDVLIGDVWLCSAMKWCCRCIAHSTHAPRSRARPTRRSAC